MVLHGYLKLCVYFFYKEHTVTVATRVFYYPPGGYFTPPPLKKIFFHADTITMPYGSISSLTARPRA